MILEFGLKKETDGGYVHGEWHVWIYQCVWRIEEKGNVLAASEDDRSHLERTVKVLENRILESVRIEPPSLDTAFLFEGDLKLKTFGIYSQPEAAEHWMLYTPQGMVLNVGPGSSVSVEAASGEGAEGLTKRK